MPRKISKCDHTYAGVDFHPGDPIEVEQEHVPLLEALGRIEREDSAAPSGRQYLHLPKKKSVAQA